MDNQKSSIAFRDENETVQSLISDLQIAGEYLSKVAPGDINDDIFLSIEQQLITLSRKADNQGVSSELMSLIENTLSNASSLSDQIKRFGDQARPKSFYRDARDLGKSLTLMKNFGFKFSSNIPRDGTLPKRSEPENPPPTKPEGETPAPTPPPKKKAPKTTPEDIPANLLFRIFSLGNALHKNVVTDKAVTHLSDDILEFKPYVQALRDFIVSEDTTTPLTIGIDGPWGTGKTSLMRMLQSELDSEYSFSARLRESFRRIAWLFFFLITYPIWLLGNLLAVISMPPRAQKNRRILGIQAGLSYDPIRHYTVDRSRWSRWAKFWAWISSCHSLRKADRYPTVWFNAWRFDQEEQIWAALALEILNQIKHQFGWFSRIAFWIKLTWKRFTPFQAFFAMLWRIAIPLVFVLLSWSYNSYVESQKSVSENSIAGTLVEIPSWVFIAGGLISAAIPVWKILQDPFQVSVKDVFDRPDYREKVGFIGYFEKDFSHIIHILTHNWGYRPLKLVIFIDDLDRCDPKKVSRIVQAVNLFLDSEYCVFVIGMDATTVVASLEATYKETFEQVGYKTGATVSPGRLYLDKIIQVPFHVPRITKIKIEKLVDEMMKEKGKAIILPDLIAFDSAPNGDGNLPADNTGNGKKDDKSKDETSIDRASYVNDDVKTAIQVGSNLLGENPRQVKRFVNLFRLQVYIAEKQGLLEQKLIGQKTIGLNLDLLAIWVAWSIRWAEIVDHMSEDVEFDELRKYLISISSAVNSKNKGYPYKANKENDLNTNLSQVRGKYKEDNSHWSNAPWERWFAEPDFRKAVKMLEVFWVNPKESHIDWLQTMLTMTRTTNPIA